MPECCRLACAERASTTQLSICCISGVYPGFRLDNQNGKFTNTALFDDVVSIQKIFRNWIVVSSFLWSREILSDHKFCPSRFIQNTIWLTLHCYLYSVVKLRPKINSLLPEIQPPFVFLRDVQENDYKQYKHSTLKSFFRQFDQELANSRRAIVQMSLVMTCSMPR